MLISRGNGLRLQARLIRRYQRSVCETEFTFGLVIARDYIITMIFCCQNQLVDSLSVSFFIGRVRRKGSSF